MSITREEIRQLCIAHDRFMAEQASETIRRSPVSETGAAGIIYKDYDNNAMAAAPAEETDWSGWERWMSGHLDNLRREINDDREKLIDSIADGVVQLLDQERDASNRKLAKLQAENIEIKGLLSDMLALLGKSDVSKAGYAIDVLRRFLGKRTDAA